MTAKEQLRKALLESILNAATIIQKAKAEPADESFSFSISYQDFFTKASRVVEVLAKDRLNEFVGYYLPDPKRKDLGYGTYVIQDYIKGVAPNRYKIPDFDCLGQACQGVFNQYTILKSLEANFDSVVSDIQGGLLAEILDAELSTARELTKISHRAAGALAGVILEGHLQKVADAHKVTIKKTHPTISDLNDPLKSANVYDQPTWRKISYFADIRNICSHKKSGDPTPEQVTELIEGVNWAIKTII